MSRHSYGDGVRAQAELVKQRRLAAKEERSRHAAALRPLTRVALTKFRELAIEAGWDGPDDQFSRLAKKLRQAGHDGEITFWGRNTTYDVGEEEDQTVLERIPSEHFTEFGVSAVDLADNPTNYDIFTVRPGSGDSESRGVNYRDIHLDEATAKSWLASNPPAGGVGGAPRRLSSSSIQRLTNVDERSTALAGIVSALLERALGYGFHLPLPANDSFVGRYETLNDSDHPILTDRLVNQLRPEFLHYTGVVGSARELRGTAREREEDRQQLAHFGRLLIDFLEGGILSMPSAAQVALDRLPHLNESAGQYAALAKRSRKLYYVHLLWRSGSTLLYGSLPESNVLTRIEIPQDEYRQWHFEKDGRILKKTHEPHVYYNNIHVRKDDLDSALRQLGA